MIQNDHEDKQHRHEDLGTQFDAASNAEATTNPTKARKPTCAEMATQGDEDEAPKGTERFRIGGELNDGFKEVQKAPAADNPE